jgi:DNA recombination-dependent growth factor C
MILSLACYQNQLVDWILQNSIASDCDDQNDNELDNHGENTTVTTIMNQSLIASTYM